MSIHPCVLALTISAVMLPACRATDPARSGAANLVLITVQSLRADRIGPGESATTRTPAMDALARRGIVFHSAWTPSPEETPAIASIMTGRYPRRHGVTTGHIRSLPSEAITMAEVLRGRGYRTAAFAGALTLHPKYCLDQGFESYASAFADVAHPRDLPDIGMTAGRIVDEALEFLERAHDDAFFLWANFYGPNYPYAAPAPFDSEFRDDPYQGEVAYLDRELGRLFAKLDDYDLADRTLVVLAGTQGEGLGDHGEDHHGLTLQAATTRVPLIIAGPGLPGGEEVAAPVSLVDILPTVAGTLGLGEIAADGVPLWPAPPALRTIHIGTWMPHRLFGWSPLRGVIEGNWKYVDGTRGELFDLSSDPLEEIDVAQEYPDQVKRLAGLLDPPPPAMTPEDLPAEIRATLSRLGFGADPQPRAPRDPRDHVPTGNDAIKGHRQMLARRFQAALFLTEEVLRRDPDNYTALLDAALLSGARGDRDRAREHLLRARDLYPDRADVYYQLAQLALAGVETGAPRRALELFSVAADLDPLHEEALINVARGRAAAGEIDEALGYLDRALGAGYADFEWILNEGALANLEGDPRFTEIVDRARRRSGVPE